MHALALQSIGHVALVEIDPPPFAEDEILVRTVATTICTSDLNDIRANPFAIPLPVIMGHEGAGVVAAVGSSVSHFRIGDRVAAHPVHPCGRCANCRRGWEHLCADMGHFGLNRQGTFAECFPVRADRARRVTDSVPMAAAALAEPICVCLEALAQADVPLGGTLLIVGDGPFGILIARLAQALPLARVVISGHHPYRLRFAAPAVQVNEQESADPRAALRAAVDEGDYDAAILAVGSVEALRLAQALLHPKGRLVVFSALPGLTPVDLFDLHVRELEIVGACNDQGRLDEAIDRLADPDLHLSELVTHTFPLSAYREAFELAAHGHDRALKVAFTLAEDA